MNAAPTYSEGHSAARSCCLNAAAREFMEGERDTIFTRAPAGVYESLSVLIVP